MKCKLLNVALAVSAFCALTARGNEDLYNPSKAEAAWKEEYGAKFIAQYGNFGADHSWDASSLTPYYSAATRTDRTYSVHPTDRYTVTESTLEWLYEYILGKNFREERKSFAMIVPDNEFTIVPIYQSYSELSWDFYVVVGTGENAKHIKIWSKSQDMDIITQSKDKWLPVEEAGDTEGATAIRAIGYTLDLTDYAGEMLYFYLKSNGRNQSSLDAMMLNWDCPHPYDDFTMGKEVRVISCEEKKDGDWDMNDMIFLMYGDELPAIIDVTNKEIVENKTKRYMIEDLGATDDYDFNDIVVDVTESTTKQYKAANGILFDEFTTTKTEQKATIRHLGGVIPFTLKIGETTFDEMEGVLGYNPNTDHEITGWVPDKNNISIKVEDQESGAILTAAFPKEGEVPMIIATDPEVEWMEERVGITSEWFDSLKK